MPELPEVETIRCDLEKVLVGKKIARVDILDKKIVGDSPAVFSSSMVGDMILGIERRGKLLALRLKSGKYLLIHLKMTGQLIFIQLSSRRRSGSLSVAGGHQVGKNDLQVPNKFTRVIISFGKGILYFNDMRRFGYLKIVSQDEKEKIFKNNFGIEPLTKDFTVKSFQKLFAGRKTNVKALLMNQKLVAGLGNIYVDEICFCAGVLPWRSASSLGEVEIKSLFTCTSKVLKVAIKNRGTTFKNYLDSEGKKGDHYRFLNVYGRKGKACKKCKNPILKKRHAGRGTHYCEVCQK